MEKRQRSEFEISRILSVVKNRCVTLRGYFSKYWSYIRQRYFCHSSINWFSCFNSFPESAQFLFVTGSSVLLLWKVPKYSHSGLFLQVRAVHILDKCFLVLRLCSKYSHSELFLQGGYLSLSLIARLFLADRSTIESKWIN